MASKRPRLSRSCKKIAKSMTTVLDLNVYVLKHIFSYLDIEDLAAAAQTCQLFSEAFHSCRIECVKFRIGKGYIPDHFGPLLQPIYNFYSLEAMQFVFSRIGQTIRSVECNMRYHVYDKTINSLTWKKKYLDLIVKHTPNLKSLKLLSNYQAIHLEMFREKFEFLEDLHLEFLFPSRKCDMGRLFPSSLPFLKKLNLSGCERFTISKFVCKAIVAPKLESVFFQQLSLFKFREFCEQCTALKEISFDICKLNEPWIASPESNELTHLQSILFSWMRPSDFDLSCLSHLTNLTEVHLISCPPFAVDSFLAKICKRDQLRTLNIQLNTISDESLVLLSQMRNLANFVLIYDKTLNTYVQSETLRLLWNNNFSLMILSRIVCDEKHFVDLMNFSRNLKKVQILRRGPHIYSEFTNDLSNPILKTVKFRKSEFHKFCSVFSNIDENDESIKKIHGALFKTRWRRTGDTDIKYLFTSP